MTVFVVVLALSIAVVLSVEVHVAVLLVVALVVIVGYSSFFPCGYDGICQWLRSEYVCCMVEVITNCYGHCYRNEVVKGYSVNS